jgi:hypothetical protein
MVMEPDVLETMSLVALTSVAANQTQSVAGSDTAPASGQAASSDIPQAYTWGKPLPGGELFQAVAPVGNGIPQAYTWGKPLPGGDLFQPS